MSRKTTRPASLPADELELQVAPVEGVAAEASADSEAEAQADADPELVEEVSKSEESVHVQVPATVRALVLLDCIYGKNNEVREFEPALARAAAADGYIDLHPNAVAFGDGLKKG